MSKARLKPSPSTVKEINYLVYNLAMEGYAVIKLVGLHEIYLRKVKKAEQKNVFSMIPFIKVSGGK